MEVIIAVVILSVVVTATMRLFVSSVGYNVKSRDAQRAITVAESAMESFKAYHLKDLCLQFGAGTGGAPFKGVSSDSLTTRSVTAKNGATSLSSPLDGENELDTSATDYEFWIKNAVEENRYYDVKILVHKAKSEKVLKMDDVNPHRDAVCQLKENDALDGIAKIADEAKAKIAALPAPDDLLAGGKLTFSSLTLNSLERNIVLTAKHDSTTGADKVEMEVSYKYSGSYTYTYPSTTSSTKTVDENIDGTVKKIFDETTGAEKMLVYDNTETVASVGGDLKNIYLYYYPMYRNAMSGVVSAQDNINVDCSGLANGVNVHISKQKATLYSNALLQTYEAGYHVKANLKGNAVLVHNLDEKLGGGSSIPAPGISGGTGTAKELGEGILEEKGVLYNVEVLVYNAGDDTKELASFVGTMND